MITPGPRSQFAILDKL